MKTYNLNSPEIVHDDDDPKGFQTGYDRLGPKIGASQIGGTVYEIPPGEALCPYHYEYPEEEWLIVLEGTATLRHPGGQHRSHHRAEHVEEQPLACVRRERVRHHRGTEAPCRVEAGAREWRHDHHAESQGAADHEACPALEGGRVDRDAHDRPH